MRTRLLGAASGSIYVLLAALALGQSSAGRPSSVSARADRIRAEARTILFSPEFAPERPRTGALQYIGKQIRTVLEALGRWLSRLFRFRGAAAPMTTANVLYWILLGGLVLGMAYLLAFALRRWGGRGASSDRTTRVVDAADPDESGSQEPDAWMAAARKHAAGGDYLRAYRAVFVALLLRLDRAGVIHYERARTNGDYLRAMRKGSDLFQIVRPLSAAFDAHWYGSRPVTESEYEGAVESYDRAVSGLTPNA